MKLSIIIVHYSESKALWRCLVSIYKFHPQCSFEVVVVDNGSKRLTLPKYQHLIYLKSPGNVGYGRGNNLGVARARGEYLLIINPDTKVLPGALDSLVAFLDKHKKAAIVAPSLVFPNGKIFPQQGTSKLTPLSGIMALSFLNKLFPENPISRGYWLTDSAKDQVRKTDVVPGSAFLVRRKVFAQLKGFDENFFLYFEESDFCKRVQGLGYQIFMIPEAQIVHYWQAKKPDSRRSQKIFAQSRFYYFNKHYGLPAAWAVELFCRISKWHFLLLAVIMLLLMLLI